MNDTIYHIDTISMEERVEKFKYTCQVYHLNNWELPEFEIKYAKSYGLTDDVINEIIKTFNLKLKNG